MFVPPFCPYRLCALHVKPATANWWRKSGYHETKAFGLVQRFQCRACGRTFSTQTFSTHYYAKRIINLRDLERRCASSMSVRGLSRDLRCSCGTIQNRLYRLSLQGIALQALLRPKARPTEPVCFDGLVSFDRSQFYPNDIGISITQGSRFVLGLSHATTRRAGKMTKTQAERIIDLYEGNVFEERAVERSLSEHLDMIMIERPQRFYPPFTLVTDQKTAYVEAIKHHPLYRGQDREHRMVHIQVSSKAPRNFQNPLFASNYYDREVRKDQAHHRRETVCFARDPSNGMTRMYVHMVYHNYEKIYLINWKVDRKETAAEMAGIPRSAIWKTRHRMFTRRAFFSHQDLREIDRKVWVREVYDPIARGLTRGYFPKFALM